VYNKALGSIPVAQKENGACRKYRVAENAYVTFG
jgi:hypothetical protein